MFKYKLYAVLSMLFSLPIFGGLSESFSFK